eukprot:scaffold248676_cov21-Tisochrysis_lutea.AAC.1
MDIQVIQACDQEGTSLLEGRENLQSCVSLGEAAKKVPVTYSVSNPEQCPAPAVLLALFHLAAE